MRKTIRADLVADVVSSYDQTKTTIQGRARQANISGVDVLGPVRNKFVDTFSDSGIAPGLFYLSANNRLFVAATAPTNGTTYDLLPILCYDFNLTTGAFSYVGRIDVQLPNLAATVHTLRSFKVYNDSSNTGWKICITTTASVLINGGLFVVNNIDKTDFIPISFPTIPMATSTNQKAVYFLQDPSAIGVGQLNTIAAGSIIDQAVGRIYIHNGVAATHQYYVYDLTATPTITPASVTVSVASPGIVSHAGHTFLNNDPVVFTAGTLPTGLTVGTVYFVRNPVAGVSYELSLTSGGASINTTGSPSVGAQITRAWGTTGSNWVHKTGNLPALSGTLLLTDAEDFATPQHTTNAGFDCAFFATTSTLYLGRLSELTSGTTSWPSLVSANQLGAPGEIINVSALTAGWSNSIDRCVYSTSASRFVMKRVVSNEVDRLFGTQNLSVLEATMADPIDFGANTSTNLDFEAGWLAINGATVGQRGILLMDARSDSLGDFSYVVTKVLDIKDLEVKSLAFLRLYNTASTGLTIQYRTSGFGVVTGGWTDVDSLRDISLPLADQIQFKILFSVMGKQSTIPQQVNELLIEVESKFGISDNWEFSDDYSDNNTPSRTAFRLKKVYDTSVPTLYYRAYDLSDVLVVNHNTVTNAANFEYSTDNGLSWNPLGTIPNVVGTLIRYTFTSPPGVDIRPGLKES